MAKFHVQSYKLDLFTENKANLTQNLCIMARNTNNS